MLSLINYQTINITDYYEDNFIIRIIRSNYKISIGRENIFFLAKILFVHIILNNINQTKLIISL